MKEILETVTFVNECAVQAKDIAVKIMIELVQIW